MALAACGGAVAAFVGLNTWKKQLLWEADREASKGIIFELIKLKSALREARNPHHREIMSASFSDAGYLEVVTDQVGYENHRYVSQNSGESGLLKRIVPVTDSMAKLRALVEESHAIWGKNIFDSWRRIEILIVRYLEAVDVRIAWSMLDAEAKRKNFFSDDAELRANYNVVYCDVTEYDLNQFSVEFSEEIERMLQVLRKKMGNRP